MRITRVSTRAEDLQLARPYTIAFRTVSEVRNFIVEVETDSRLVGRGAASPEPHVTGESAFDCEQALRAHGAHLEGESALDLVRLVRSLHTPLAHQPAARAAFDMALHDLYAQHLGRPLVDVLGRAHTALPTSITIGIKDRDATLEEAREYLARGFRILKVKLGHDLEEDIERLRELRATLGYDFALRVDPNQGYRVDELKRLGALLDEVAVEFVEQPLPVANDGQLRDLDPDLRARLAADESLLNERDALTLLEPPRACGIWNIKLMKCGGIYPARRIADIADAAGVALMWGCMDESIISISAALHAALASPATRYLDLDGSLDLARDVVGGGFVLEAGLLRTGDAPGLGLTDAAGG